MNSKFYFINTLFSCVDLLDFVSILAVPFASEKQYGNLLIMRVIEKNHGIDA